MAAPVVGAMMADILPYLGVRPSLSGEEASRQDTAMPQLVGLSLEEAGQRLREAGLRCRSIGEGQTVTAQLPAALWQIARGTETILYLGEEISTEKESVPNLAGMRYNEARDTLSYYGLFLHTMTTLTDEQNAHVSTQSIRPGTTVSHGTVIEVVLVSDDESMLGKY